MSGVLGDLIIGLGDLAQRDRRVVWATPAILDVSGVLGDLIDGLGELTHRDRRVG